MGEVKQNIFDKSVGMIVVLLLCTCLCVGHPAHAEARQSGDGSTSVLVDLAEMENITEEININQEIPQSSDGSVYTSSKGSGNVSNLPKTGRDAALAGLAAGLATGLFVSGIGLVGSSVRDNRNRRVSAA